MRSFLIGAGCILAASALGATACRPAPDPPASAVPAAAPASPEGAVRPRIVILGDSLTAGYGLAQDEAFPAVLQTLLDQHGQAYEVVNAGVSGDTTAGGRRRLEWALAGDVRVLVVALGGNDALRGLSAEEMKRNLEDIIDRTRARGIDVLLAGMEAPPNLGSGYTTAFRRVFADLARERQVRFLPFLLEGVAGDPSLNQPDGIHPNADGARVVAEHVLAAMRPMLEGPAGPDGVTAGDGADRGSTPGVTDASRR